MPIYPPRSCSKHEGNGIQSERMTQDRNDWWNHVSSQCTRKCDEVRRSRYMIEWMIVVYDENAPSYASETLRGRVSSRRNKPWRWFDNGCPLILQRPRPIFKNVFHPRCGELGGTKRQAAFSLKINVCSYVYLLFKKVRLKPYRTPIVDPSFVQNWEDTRMGVVMGRPVWSQKILY